MKNSNELLSAAAAYLYRRKYCALKRAVHKKLSKTPETFLALDGIMRCAKRIETSMSVADDKQLKRLEKKLKKETGNLKGGK